MVTLAWSRSLRQGGAFTGVYMPDMPEFWTGKIKKLKKCKKKIDRVYMLLYHIAYEGFS
jgi:hypothetical protein